MNRPPGGPVRPKTSLRPPRVGNIAGVTSDALAMGGAAPILFWFVTACLPRAWSARWCGLAPRPQPPREQAAGGAAARGVRVQLRPLPRVAVPSGGGGASPRFRGGGGPALLRPAGRGGSGGWGGGPLRRSPPPAPSGVGLPSLVFGAPPWGILVLWGLPGSRRRRARPGRPPVGQCGGGEGGGRK